MLTDVRPFFLLFCCLGVGSCGGTSTEPTAPIAPQVPSCQRNNTAGLSFENRSTRGVTFDVYLDRLNVASISPTQKTPEQTVVAGVQHAVEFRVTNTAIVGCTALPIPVSCTTTTIFCAF